MTYFFLPAFWPFFEWFSNDLKAKIKVYLGADRIAAGNCSLSDEFQQHQDIFGTNSSNLLRLNYIQA